MLVSPVRIFTLYCFILSWSGTVTAQEAAGLRTAGSAELPAEPRFWGVRERDLLDANGDWGGVSGQIVFGGDAPETKLLIKAGAQIKDGSICAVSDHRDETLLVDDGTNGVANCFVYLYKWRRKPPVHPLLAKPLGATVVQNIRE